AAARVRLLLGVAPGELGPLLSAAALLHVAGALRAGAAGPVGGPGKQRPAARSAPDRTEPGLKLRRQDRERTRVGFEVFARAPRLVVDEELEDDRPGRPRQRNGPLGRAGVLQRQTLVPVEAGTFSAD